MRRNNDDYKRLKFLAEKLIEVIEAMKNGDNDDKEAVDEIIKAAKETLKKEVKCG